MLESGKKVDPAFAELFSEEFSAMVRFCEDKCKKDCVGWNACPKVEAFKKRLEEAAKD